MLLLTIPATPLHWKRTSVGFFMSEIYQRYEKPALNIDQQLNGKQTTGSYKKE
jgi:hypothetical protein